MNCKVKAPNNINTHRIKTPVLTSSSIIFSTIFMTLLIIGGAYFLESLVSSLSQQFSVFTTSIPWIQTESHCEHSNWI